MKRFFSATAIVICSSLVSVGVAASPITSSDPVVSKGEVYRVIDGDTFMINLNKSGGYERLKKEASGHPKRQQYLKDRYRSIRVRLASVDTPESVHQDESLNTAEGRKVSAIVKKMAQGKKAKVACYDWGHYGRSICNLGIKNGSEWVDLGGWLIKEGYSDYETGFGQNPFYHERYQQLDTSASH